MGLFAGILWGPWWIQFLLAFLSKEMDDFIQILDCMRLQTPHKFMMAIQSFGTSQTASKFLTADPTGKETFTRMSWSGKISSCNVIKHVLENKDRE